MTDPQPAIDLHRKVFGAKKLIDNALAESIGELSDRLGHFALKLQSERLEPHDMAKFKASIDYFEHNSKNVLQDLRRLDEWFRGLQ